jgi:hypothetical protein
MEALQADLLSLWTSAEQLLANAPPSPAAAEVLPPGFPLTPTETHALSVVPVLLLKAGGLGEGGWKTLSLGHKGRQFRF